MRKVSKVIGYFLFGAAGVAVLAAGGWYLAMRNVEKPAYAVVERDGPIEIRDYPEMILADVVRRGDRWNAVRAGFRPLAGFIFAREREGEKISMTAPVTQARDGAGNENAWVISFIMPSKHTLESLPKPAGTDVRLRTVAAARRVAIRFSGVATDALIAKNEERLRAWLQARDLEPAGVPTYAYYDDPLTPGPLRRNEVLFDLTPTALVTGRSAES